MHGLLRDTARDPEGGRVSVRFSRPRTLEDALGQLADEDVLLLAGGQSLVLLMNTGLLQPDKLVLITGIPDLQGVSVDGDILEIGAVCTHGELANHVAVTEHFPAAAYMFHTIGNIRVRASGTIGGNLVHADPAQDPPVMLAALDARAVVDGPRGRREVAVEDISLAPLVSVLEHDEILTRVRVPLVGEDTSCSYVKLRPGTNDDYATVSVAARVTLDSSGRVNDARLFAGAVGPAPVSLQDAADLLVGQSSADEDVLRALRDIARDSVSPFPDRRGSADYKREMTGVAAARAVRSCTDGNGDRGSRMSDVGLQ